MIKAIIFDFDGVICESAGIKTQAFRKLFSRWPEHYEAIMEYHIRNSGISRFVKFKYLYEELLKQPYTKKIEDQLVYEYGELVVQAVKDAPFVKGAKEFLENFFERYMLFIASATPYMELKDIIEHKAIGKFFKKIYGFPTVKSDAIQKILTDYDLTKEEVIFIGDGESDWIAAKDKGIRFVLRLTSENQYLRDKLNSKINNLAELEDIVDMCNQNKIL